MIKWRQPNRPAGEIAQQSEHHSSEHCDNQQRTYAETEFHRIVDKAVRWAGITSTAIFASQIAIPNPRLRVRLSNCWLLNRYFGFCRSYCWHFNEFSLATPFASLDDTRIAILQSGQKKLWECVAENAKVFFGWKERLQGSLQLGRFVL
jgi:hypothetical protein